MEDDVLGIKKSSHIFVYRFYQSGHRGFYRVIYAVLAYAVKIEVGSLLAVNKALFIERVDEQLLGNKSAKLVEAFERIMTGGAYPFESPRV